MISCDSQCSVALPRGAMGWSVVCDCGISLSYSLALLGIGANSHRVWHFSQIFVLQLGTSQFYYRGKYNTLFRTICLTQNMFSFWIPCTFFSYYPNTILTSFWNTHNLEEGKNRWQKCEKYFSGLENVFLHFMSKPLDILNMKCATHFDKTTFSCQDHHALKHLLVLVTFL